MLSISRIFSTNEEISGREADNEMILRIPVEIKAQLSLIGRSTPEQLDYSIRNRTPGAEAIFDSEIGPVVSHLYQVTLPANLLQNEIHVAAEHL